MSMYIRYKKGYKYQLHRGYTLNISIRPEKGIKTRFISLSMNSELDILQGYAWDGASGPTFDSRSSMRGSLVHDALYQLMRMDLLDRKWKSAVDILFERILIEGGMWKWRARIWYRGVAEFATDATLAENQKEVHTAPDNVKFLGGA